MKESDINELVDTEFIQMAGGYSDDDSYDDCDSYGATYSQSNNSQDYSDGDRGTTYSKSNDSQEYSDDESDGDRGTTYSKSNNNRDYSDDESYDSGESKAKSGEYSDDDSHALGDYNTSYSGPKSTSGGNRVSVHQQTYRLKNEDKQSGSYDRFTAKDKTVKGEPFVDRYGNRGYKNERTTSSTYKTGDKRGYTEYSREEKVKHVDYSKSSYRNNKSVKSYSKYSKH
ncbi:hypothetical protein POM88_009694 [Heracleum sosnowskyi]|uniref:Uncharacterized protein n=1 Tax=Heracleum sosnowskyi TaxID=360622 RepID=A0AAD8J9V7_9APIA|nr:hypothetical protein POM88_009694 [Heracleum sosnowskyi]